MSCLFLAMLAALFGNASDSQSVHYFGSYISDSVCTDFHGVQESYCNNDGDALVIYIVPSSRQKFLVKPILCFMTKKNKLHSYQLCILCLVLISESRYTKLRWRTMVPVYFEQLNKMPRLLSSLTPGEQFIQWEEPFSFGAC